MQAHSPPLQAYTTSASMLTTSAGILTTAAGMLTTSAGTLTTSAGILTSAGLDGSACALEQSACRHRLLQHNHQEVEVGLACLMSCTIFNTRRSSGRECVQMHAGTGIGMGLEK